MADPEAPGWDAIDVALGRIYGLQEPRHFGTVLKHALGGPDPIDGISVYAADGPPAHWHYVTYGFSELHRKEWDDPEVSGFGFELTFRLLRGPKDQEPPQWPLNLLQNLARYVFKSGNRFASGHHLNANGPIALDQETDLQALAFLADPQLGKIPSPHGTIDFLQAVGLTLDEWEAIRLWNTDSLLEELRLGNPLSVTDLNRTSLFSDAARAAGIRARMEREGSSMGMTYVDRIEWSRGTLTVGANAAAQFLPMFAARLLHGRDFALQGRQGTLLLKPSGKASWKAEDDLVTIELPEALAREMASTLRAKRGTYRWDALPGLAVVVVPSEIKDREGKIVRVIG